MGRVLRRTGAVAAAAVLVVTPALVGAVPSALALTPVTLNILTVNDFHGRINDDTVDFAKTIEKLRAESATANAGVDNTLLLGAGDFIGASEFTSAIQQDQPTIDVFNSLGLVASAVGNHEFDQGFADLRDRVIDGGNNAQWDYLGANVYDTATGDPALQPYGIYPVNGIDVGVIGVVTEETPQLVSPGGITGLTFGDPVEAVNRVADELTDGDPGNGEADVLIALFHEGAPEGDEDSTLAEQLAVSPVFAEIVQQTSPKVSAIVNGHTHQAYAWEAPVPGVQGATRPVLQTGNYAANVGQIELTVDVDTTPPFAVLDSTVAYVARETDIVLNPEPASIGEVEDIVAAAQAYADEIGSVPVGSITGDITTAFSGGAYGPDGYGGTEAERDDRAGESALGNLVADALLDSMSSDLRGGAEISLVNPGGLRAELLFDPDGVITYAEANGVLPFVNNLGTISLTGAQVLEVLEQQWQIDDEGEVPTRPYLQLGTSSNMSYTFDPDPDGDGVTVGDLDDQGKHIRTVSINGAPLDPTASYRVGTFSFLLQGGDNFFAFTDGTDFRDSGLIDRDAWIAYLGDNPGLTPNFSKHAVATGDVDTTPTAGDTVTVELSGLDMTSLGAPANTAIVATLVPSGGAVGSVDGPSVQAELPAEFTVSGGTAVVEADIPDDTAAGAWDLVLGVTPAGSVIRIPLQVAAAPVVTTSAPTTPTSAPTTVTTEPTTAVPTTGTTVTTSTPVASSDLPTTTSMSSSLSATGLSQAGGEGALVLAVVLIVAGGGVLVLARRRTVGRKH
ncbi:bifunctional metallophosphatase/5'-nucleotidase [Nakamurella sp. YIM 132087]|uniref:Bifunctional metallophosphatase/5'-nucleotidase n=1 Tax=Nakamurella alba TaxID=2665158 RepID=A0A7K1FL01_9ACTN|nr:bifunctional UDP-sugar hydrolase/5'-nucleotidase [Nakamurella alba]MTD14788.1 bifunctional metallophosphatase/5'-nucleotidase [Nakamurella alba]